MNKTELLDKVKHLFAEVETPAAPQQAPVVPVVEPAKLETSTAKLADGTEVSYDKLEVGGVMSVAGVPCAAGEYTFEDGTSVTVGEAGAITAVKPVEEMAAPVTEPANPVNNDEKFADYDKRIAALEAALAQSTANYNEVSAKYSKQIDLTKAVVDLVENLVGEPSVEPPAQKRKVSLLSNVEAKSKSISRYEIAAQKLKDEAV